MTEEQKAVSSANDAAQSQSAASEAALEAMGYKQELKRAMSVPDMLVYGLIFMVPSRRSASKAACSAIRAACPRSCTWWAWWP